jgi:predicted chitinase
MLISPPFLTDAVQDDDENAMRYSFTGGYPVNSFLEWHNGVHLIAPVDGAKGYAPVRAIADGTVLYVRNPQTTQNPQQNYDAFSDHPKWTDDGMVILEHNTEIGATDTAPVIITYYSVYMHLSALCKFKSAVIGTRSTEKELSKGDQLLRKQELGVAGQIYGQDAHLHFEICMDEANLKKLIGRDTPSLPDMGLAPTANGRTDAVWGSTHVYLPASTPVLAAEPRTHNATTGSTDLGTALWVEIAYAGNATLTSYFAEGEKAGQPILQAESDSCLIESDGEYALYKKAAERHASLHAFPAGQSSRCGWYDLLRFGRSLAPNSKIAAGIEHWRKIKTPAGDRWADLNASGTYKFSDADFPSFLGWQCIGDDAEDGNELDQRCDSPTLRTLLALQIPDIALRANALSKTGEGRTTLSKQATQPRTESFKRKLTRLICRFPSEFDRSTFEARYAHVKEEPHFKDDATGKNWAELKAHIEAICCADLPPAYKSAQWHFHPIAFITALSKCAWLQEADMRRCYPKITDDHLHDVCSELNKYSSRHFLNTALRQSHFFGQIRQEAGQGMKTASENLSYPPQRLKDKFSYYQKNPAEAENDGYTKEADEKINRPALQENIANKAYGFRNGNIALGDGWLYRGRGLKQLTGKYNYNAFALDYDIYWEEGNQDFVADPDLLIQTKYGIRSAVWFWASNKCMKPADQGISDACIDAVTAIVNRGELGKPNSDGSFTLTSTTPAFDRRMYANSAFFIFS